MYRDFYSLDKMPFQISTDPAFLWLGEKHKEALATLKYGVLENKGFLLLTGDVGTGKTTLINALVSSLGDDVIVAKVPDPGMEKMDLLNYISHAFNMGKEFARKDAFLVHFGHFLNTAYTRRKKVLLIIDESQRFSQDLLEEVRLLSNIEKNEAKLLNIFLVGQSEFNDVLLESGNRALRQRITLNYSLDHLNMSETGQLVQHRLRVAGAKEEIFDSGALRAIYEFSKGFPRKINIICDHCMILGFATGKKRITAQMVKECADEMRLPVSKHTRGNEQPIVVAPLPLEESHVDEEIPAVDPVHIADPSGTSAGSSMNVMVMVMLLVIGLAYLTPGGREIVYQIRGYGKNVVTVAADYIPALSAGAPDIAPTVVTNTTLLEAPKEKVVRAVRESLNVVPVKAGAPGGISPAVVASATLSERIASDIENNPPSAGIRDEAGENPSEESVGAVTHGVDQAFYSDSQPSEIPVEKDEVLSESSAGQEITDEPVPVELTEITEATEPIDTMVEVLSSAPVAEVANIDQKSPAPGEEQHGQNVASLAEPDKEDPEVDTSVSDNDSPAAELPGNSKSVEKIAAQAVVVEQVSPVTAAEEEKDQTELPMGADEKSIEGYSEEIVQVLYDLEVAEYRDETMEGLHSGPAVAEISSEDVIPGQVASNSQVELADVNTPVEPVSIIEKAKTAVTDALEPPPQSPVKAISEMLEKQETPVLSVDKGTLPPKNEQEGPRDLSSLFTHMNNSKSADIPAADGSDTETATEAEPVDPIDPAKVIDWVLSKRSK